MGGGSAWNAGAGSNPNGNGSAFIQLPAGEHTGNTSGLSAGKQLTVVWRSSRVAEMPSREVIEQELLWRQAARYRMDPLGFVQWAYPWGKPGPLEKYIGPDAWQADFLKQLGEEVRKRNFDGHTPVLPIRFITASGHGIGKSVLVAFIVNWIMSTRAHAQGTVTANTFQQLSTRTWATIQTWTKRCITGHWFEVTGQRLYHHQFKESWCIRNFACMSRCFIGRHPGSWLRCRGIKARVRCLALTVRQLAAEYDVARGAISDVLTRRNWVRE